MTRRNTWNIIPRWSGMDEALAYVRPGDTFVVWKLDRAGRSLTHLIELLKGLKERGIEFISLKSFVYLCSREYSQVSSRRLLAHYC